MICTVKDLDTLGLVMMHCDGIDANRITSGNVEREMFILYISIFHLGMCLPGRQFRLCTAVWVLRTACQNCVGPKESLEK